MKKARPIVFTGINPLLIARGVKTQTRRLMNPQPEHGARWAEGGLEPQCAVILDAFGNEIGTHTSPHGQPGDFLWVKEPWAVDKGYDGVKPSELPTQHSTGLSARIRMFRPSDTKRPDWVGQSRSPRFMPRWCACLFLEVVSVRVERVQVISPTDAAAEGIACLSKDGGRTWKHGVADRDGWPGEDDFGWHWHEWELDPRKAFAKAWEMKHGKGAWERNDFVFATTFRLSDEGAMIEATR